MSLNDARPVRMIAPYPILTAKCIADGHMHFMSGRTTPLPLLWNQGLPGKRLFIEWLASSWLTRVIKSRNIGRLQKQDITSSERGPGIAAVAVEQHDDVFSNGFHNVSTMPEYKDIEYLTFMVAMMMDMEYAGLDGYQKKLIYYRSKDSTYVYKKRHEDGTFEEKNVPGKEKDLFQLWKTQVGQTEKAIRDNPWKFLAFYHYDPRRWNYDLNTPLDEGLNFGPWNHPFSRLATPQQSGLYIGFKMYTPLGYKPDDPNLPYLDAFFAKCATEGIPIIVHCSAGGMITHDWASYLDFEKDPTIKNNYRKLCAFYKEINNILYDEELTRPVDYRNMLAKSIADHPDAVAFLKKRDCVEKMNDDDFRVHLERRYDDTKGFFDGRREYFVDNITHPRAWRRVLLKHPELKICFAHFGGEDWVKGPHHYQRGLESPWVQEIISLIKEYKNVYTDISYFNTDIGNSSYKYGFEAGLKQFLHEEELLLDKELEERGTSVLDRILWGTDWYMTEIDNLWYEDHCLNMKKICDNDKWEGSWKTFYIRFTMVNSMEFFRLGEVAENFEKELTIKTKDGETLTKINAITQKVKRVKIESDKFRVWLNER